MLDLKKEFNNIEKIFRYLNLENIEEAGVATFLNEDVVYAKTPSNQYYIRINHTKYTKEKNYSINKINRIKTLETFSENGVHVMFPMKFNEKYFINYKSREYEIYQFKLTKHLKIEEINDKLLKKIATNQAIMHNVNIKKDLPCNYRKIDIKFDKVFKKLKKCSPKGYKTLYDNIYKLDEALAHYNKNLKYALNSLTVGYDNYNLENIEWVDNFMYLVDYRNCCKINMAVSLAESAYFVSYKDKKIDFARYSLYLKTYLKKYGPLSFDYKEALYVSLNKKFAELNDLINISIKEKEDFSKSISSIAKEIVAYADNIENMYNVYLTSVKQQ